MEACSKTKTCQPVVVEKLKEKLWAITFSDGENAANEYIQAFCKEFAAHLDQYFKESFITPSEFIQAYLKAVERMDDPKMAPLTIAAAYNVAREVSSMMFAEAVKEELLVAMIVAALEESGFTN